jgi:hypothetical protein
MALLITRRDHILGIIQYIRDFEEYEIVSASSSFINSLIRAHNNVWKLNIIREEIDKYLFLL